MTSRDKILDLVKSNQPAFTDLPQIPDNQQSKTTNKHQLITHFKEVLASIGGTVVEVNSIQEVADYITEHFSHYNRIVSNHPQITLKNQDDNWKNQLPHTYEDIDLAILNTHFAVAENAAAWITEDLMHQRVIPFICQQLALIISADSIVPTMQEAYNIIGEKDYGFGAFIAGPSKTADIEQSLVLGAHGPKSMIAFLFS